MTAQPSSFGNHHHHHNNTTTSSSTSSNSNHVRVVTRIRPLSHQELKAGAKPSVSSLAASSGTTTTTTAAPVVQVAGNRWFEFDGVLHGNCSQADVYEQSGARQAVRDDLFRGFHCTILAYGQTGAGKTYTMSGGESGSDNDNDDAGIIPRACADLFHQIETKCDGNAKVELSYTELYNEQIRDLLAPAAAAKTASPPPLLRIRETLQGEIYVAGVVTKTVSSPAEIRALIRQAAAQRVVASTAMNAVSSRSHTICTLRVQGLLSPPDDDDLDAVTKFSSKLTLVDLAGSERIKKTGATGTRQAEGININKSLLVLGQVVAALADKKKPPYRDSKLTRLLQDSLGGNSRTLLLACVSSAASNLDESINTLRYASRARKITNTATRNLVEHISPEEAAALKRQNVLLQQQVAELQQTIRQMSVATTSTSTSTSSSHAATAHGNTSPSTITTATSSLNDDDDDDDVNEPEEQPQTSATLATTTTTTSQEDVSKASGDAPRKDTIPEQIDVSDESSPPPPQANDESNQQAPFAVTQPKTENTVPTTTTTPSTTSTPEIIGADVAEYIIEISNLKVQVAQLRGELDESKFLAKRHAELKTKYAEAQTEAESARTAASYLSNIVDELRDLKQDEIDRKQQLLQMKLKEHNVFSLVHAMLDTYRMQVNRLATEFEKSVVRAIETMDLTSDNNNNNNKQRKSQKSPNNSSDGDDNDDDDRSIGSLDTGSVAPSVASKTSFLDVKSMESFIDTTKSVGSFLYNRRPPAVGQRLKSSWWKRSLSGSGDDRSDDGPPMPWKEATDTFQSKIRDIEKSISSDVESLMSNMAQLSEESKIIEDDIGTRELESQYLLSANDESKNELVDHLSSMLVVKQA